jgi:hypothetical protein
LQRELLVALAGEFHFEDLAPVIDFYPHQRPDSLHVLDPRCQTAGNGLAQDLYVMRADESQRFIPRALGCAIHLGPLAVHTVAEDIDIPEEAIHEGGGGR